MPGDPAEQAYLLDYCERMGDPGLFSEPLNAITNLAFILCAWCAVRLTRDMPVKAFSKVGDIWILIGAMFAIGLGSGLWHTYARGWTVIADVIPIYIFINVYIFSLFVRIVGLRRYQAALIWLAFQFVSFGIETYASPTLLNGSIMYIPSYSMLVLATLWLAIQHKPAWRDIGTVTAIFTLSISFRSVDLAVCDSFPYGTHFLWHLLNSIVLYRLVKIVLPKTIRAGNAGA